MDQEFLEKYLRTRVQTPVPFLLLMDPSQILTGLHELIVAETAYQVVYFENDLQLRSELEWARERPPEIHFCIISHQSTEAHLPILDFLHRSLQLTVTPRELLNFIGRERWSDAVNWLRRDDFWRCFDLANRLRTQPGLALRDRDETFLASALLDTDFSKKFDPVSGFIFYFTKVASPAYQTFKENYPFLQNWLENRLFEEVPELYPLHQHPDWLQHFWLGNYAVFPDRWRNPDAARELKYQLAIKAPNLIRDQIETVEKAAFQQPQALNEYLQSQLITDSYDGWLEYVRRENFLIEPIQVILKKVLQQLILQPDYIDLKQLGAIIPRLQEHQMLRGQSKTEIPAQSDFLRLLELFKTVVQVYAGWREIHRFLHGSAANIEELIQQVYPQRLAPLAGQLAWLETLQEPAAILTPQHFQKLKTDLQALHLEIHRYFLEWLAKEYTFSLADFQRWSGASVYPFQRLAEYCRDGSNRPVYVIIFDGMRWDGWEWLRPEFEAIFPRPRLIVESLIVPLPTLTAVTRPFLLTGELAVVDERARLLEKLNLKTLEFYFANAAGPGAMSATQLLTSEAPLKILVFDIFDRRAHHSNQNLNLIYREVMTEFKQSVRPILQKIPADARVLILSDHGFIQVHGKWFSQLNAGIPSDPLRPHQRFLTLEPRQADKQHFVYLSASRLGRGDDAGLAFLKLPQILKLSPTVSSPRYAHGGISLEEMVVPMARFE
ncbi:PglZ domain-containing protein [candidate division KSB1 bacterium]|nr:PglZ domain-containing protein [candidate division KSB1 bacterium]